MESTVLVLTNSDDDLHTNPVLSKLDSLGQKFFRLDIDRLGSGELSLGFSSHETAFFCAQSFGKKIASDDIKSVWYRRPNYFNFPISDKVQRSFAEAETTAFLNGISSCLEDAFWLNNPNHIEVAKKKVLQLRRAQNIGFDVPKTIITNRPNLVTEFFKQCKGGIVFKTIDQGFLDYGEKGFNVPTTLITKEHLDKLHLVVRCPSLFQEFVDKEYDVRVTVVGDKVFATKIDSQKHRATAIDWRKPEFIGELGYQNIDLPSQVREKCLEITHGFGLQFGAIDLALGKDGKYYFFEINPNGQWQWIEYFTGACIAEAIAGMLTSANSR